MRLCVLSVALALEPVALQDLHGGCKRVLVVIILGICAAVPWRAAASSCTALGIRCRCCSI